MFHLPNIVSLTYNFTSCNNYINIQDFQLRIHNLYKFLLTSLKFIFGFHHKAATLFCFNVY